MVIMESNAIIPCAAGVLYLLRFLAFMATLFHVILATKEGTPHYSYFCLTHEQIYFRPKSSVLAKDLLTESK